MDGNAKQSVELRGKIHTFVIDRTLTIPGAAADAKATGDAIINAAVGEGVIENKVNAAVKKATDEAFAAYKEEVRAEMEKINPITEDEIKAICV